MTSSFGTLTTVARIIAFVTVAFLCTTAFVHAATLSLTPSTGVYQSGTTFTVRVVVNTAGQSVNASDATIRFNPSELSVVSVNRTGSIFNLWVTEPAFSNAAGTITFSGGLPSGYNGAAGTVMNITFRVLGSGTARVQFGDGSVLANDGRGTNVLTSMNGGSYTLQAASAAPTPEVIEYVAPANTPAAPVIISDTHADQSSWYKAKSAVLRWTLPPGVTEVRTLLDSSPSSVPTRVYETPISTITLNDLEEGVSYFHLQFRNADGWGRVAHYRLAVDSVAPTGFSIAHPDDADLTSPQQVLKASVSEDVSDTTRYMVRINANEPFEYIDETGDGLISLPNLEPGYYTVIVEVFDEAGNSAIATHSFTVLSFDRPLFTEYPTEINEQVIPVLRGQTRPDAIVTVRVQKLGATALEYELQSDAEGLFTFIPEARFTQGVYELSAVAVDQYGAMSDRSEIIRIAVQQPGFLRIGSFLVSVMSVLVPLVALSALLILGFVFMLRRLRLFRRTVSRESTEALTILTREFTTLHAVIREQEALLQSSRKTGKLTKAEADMIERFDKALQSSQRAVEKEIKDVTNLTN